MISNGVGNLDEEGRLLEAPTRMAVKGYFKSMEIIAKYASYPE